MVIETQRYIQKFIETTMQTIPLNVVDMFCKLCGVKNRMSLSVACSRLHAMNEALKFFSMREWHFATNNVKKLRSRLSSSDNQIYNLDTKTIDWETHIENFVKGTRQYLLKEKPQDIDNAKRRVTMFHYIHRITTLTLVYFISRLVYRNTRAILQLIFKLLHLRVSFVGTKTLV